jgi:hypothetical protein
MPTAAHPVQRQCPHNARLQPLHQGHRLSSFGTVTGLGKSR